MQTNLGRALLQSLVKLREQKGNVSFEDVGAVFMQMASTMHSGTAQTDQFMQEEIRSLAEYISSAKQEILSISTHSKSETVIDRAALHLDEVIRETEEASNAIMDAADAIQAATNGVGGNTEKAIMEATNRIYEACNFQDITGQRINQVIKLLSNIEERVTKLNTLSGGSGKGINVSKVVRMTAPDDKDLLNGPQLAAEAPTQEEIDLLLASLSAKK